MRTITRIEDTFVKLMIKQVKAMEEIHILEGVLNEDVICKLSNSIDITDSVMDEVGLPVENAYCIVSENSKCLDKDLEPFHYCRDWVFDCLYNLSTGNFKESIINKRVYNLWTEMIDHSLHVLDLEKHEDIIKGIANDKDKKD